MTRLAITKQHSHAIHAIRLGASVAPMQLCERLTSLNGMLMPPAEVAYVSSDLIYYVCGCGFMTIFRTRVNATAADDQPLYTHPQWLRDLEVRKVAGHHILYFTAYESEESCSFWYLDESGSAVMLRLISGAELPIPDPCLPGEETHWGAWSGGFAFDADDNLYLCTGNSVPAGVYRISGISAENLDGPLERIYASSAHSIEGLVCDGGSLYFYSGPRIYRLDPETGTEAMVYDTSDISDAAVDGLSLIPDNAGWQPLRWLIRLLQWVVWKIGSLLKR
jgi:hypothetical protein